MVTISIDDTPGKKLIFCSSYMPGDSREAPPPQILKDLVDFCKNQNWSLIVGSDANSHNIAWGSNDDNDRGDQLLEYIVANDLEICNIGSTPTFVNAIRQEVIDITLTTLDMMDRIINWKVIDDMNSDHRPIQFEVISEHIQEPQRYRNVRKTNWDLYQRELRRQMDTIDIHNDNLDELTGEMNNAINNAYNKSCKTRKRGGKRRVEWWSEQLTRLQREARTARRRYMNTPNEENRISKNRTNTVYNSEIKKAKFNSWKEFCDRLEDTSAVAKLQKVMKNGRMTDIGTLKRDDGTYTSTPKETLTELLDKLIPDQINMDNNAEDRLFLTDNNINMTEQTLTKIVNETTVRTAVKLFDPYKSPGTDGIYPVLLQKGIETLLPYLVHIFRLSLRTGKLAKQWLTTKMVFIPKVGKSDYTLAKSYRPISLMSFVLKSLERLILWHIQDEYMVRRPLNENVFSYREGASTETALHKVAIQIEKSLANKEYTMAVFLDISGAFSNTATDSMVRTLADKGVEIQTVNWVKDLLSNRTATTQHGETTVERSINTGVA